ncbi:hypothetical protein HNR46_003283 [Haloferula luteola]|uniref:Secreted protein n=1 Tax=Haloferula luteola TaxID=595692 RepID=A0A840VGS1_9BACT|nr:hypothetical protein [Haloferula luteola]MBB5353030.1 hypothetical protein [Haloferula luteola]
MPPMIRYLALLCFALMTSACLVERTVTDESGEILYQEPEVHAPFESDATKIRQVEAREEQLGEE